MRIRIAAALVAISLTFFVLSFSLPSIAQSSLFLTGKVVDRASKKPVSSVWVEVKSGKIVHRSLTGNDGKYYISGLEKGSYEINVVRQGQEVLKRSLTLTESRRYDIEL